MKKIVKRIKGVISKKIYYYKNIRPRQKWTANDLKAKQSNIKLFLTDNETQSIEAQWHWYLRKNKKGIKWFELYKTLWPNQDLKLFIPDDFYYMYIDEFFAKRLKCKIIDDKNLYDLFFYDVQQPKTVVRKIDGVYLTSDYQIISSKAFMNLCESERHAIIKQSVNSEGGKGITFYNAETDGEEVLLSCMKQENLVVQEIIQQHSILAKLHPESINTIRIITLFFEDEVQILSSVLRMGLGKSKVDNASSGGIVCGINHDGTLKSRAFDVKANCYDTHPSGVNFNSIIIPGYIDCCNLCRKLALRLVQYSRLVSWDFAIDLNGRPVLIEANLSFGQIDFHQMCNGPIFGKMTGRVLKHVFDYNPMLKGY